MASINAELLNPYVKATMTVLEKVLDEHPGREEPYAEKFRFTTNQINILIRVHGEANGFVSLSMSQDTASKIAIKMIGEPRTSFDPLSESAIAELANMICGNALQDILEAGFECDITPPKVMKGRKLQITTMALPSIVIPVQLCHGSVFLSIALQNKCGFL